MAEVVAQEHPRPYVSCIRSFGRPILPPLMTDEKRRLMRHFRALACERKEARDKRKREVLLGTLHEAKLPPPPPPPHNDDDDGDSLDISLLSSLSLGNGALPFSPPTGPLLGTKLGRVSSATPCKEPSATLVPSSSPVLHCEEEDADSHSSSSVAPFLASEVPEGTKVGPSMEKALVASTSVKPVTALVATSVATHVEVPTVTPVTSPVKEGCFSTRLSVPSLCRSRSFVVERPSLALLLWKERCRHSRESRDDVDVKIVAEPQKPPNSIMFQQSPEGSEMHAAVTRAGEHADIAQSLKVSVAFVQEASTSRMDHSPSLPLILQTGHDKTPLELNSECVQAVSVYDRSHPSLCLHMGGRNTGTSEGPPPVPEPVDVPGKTDQAPSLPDKCSSASPHFTSHVFDGDDLGGPLRIDSFAARNEMVGNILNIPVNSFSKLTRWSGPSSFLAWNPFEGITVVKNSSHAKHNAADNTLSDVPNVPKEDDSAEETAADDMFADALDDGGEEFASALPTRARVSPKFSKTFVSDSDQGDGFFVPLSTSSSRHSLCSSNTSAHSSFSVGKGFPALNSSCDAEDEEQYEDVQEPCDQRANASEHGESVERAENSLNESSASCCGQQLKYMERHVSVDNSVLTDHSHQMDVLHHTWAQDLSGGHRGTSEMPAAAVAKVVDDEDGSGTDDRPPERGQGACSTSPTSVKGDSTEGPVSLPANLSLLSRWDANQSHVDVSSLTSTSVHLDLLSETRQSLHPRWRRCFDRLAAMARGHLTRRLMKTNRVRSIIQTIRDTLECALRLHGEPHIRSGLVTPQDVELHQRLITQLTSACYDLHDVFFNIPVAERMRLIAQLRAHRTRPPVSNTRSSTDQGARKVSSATQKVLERRISRLASQDSRAQTRRPTAVVRAQTFTVTGPSDTCHTAGAAAPSGTTRKICRLPMYKV